MILQALAYNNLHLKILFAPNPSSRGFHTSTEFGSQHPSAGIEPHLKPSSKRIENAPAGADSFVHNVTFESLYATWVSGYGVHADFLKPQPTHGPNNSRNWTPCSRPSSKRIENAPLATSLLDHLKGLKGTWSCSKLHCSLNVATGGMIHLSHTVRTWLGVFSLPQNSWSQHPSENIAMAYRKIQIEWLASWLRKVGHFRILLF